jgi:hypothetical protein
MRADKSNIEGSQVKMNNGNQPIPITFNIENIPIITHIISGWEILSEVIEIRPIR